MDVYTMAQRQLTATPVNKFETREEWLTAALRILSDLMPEGVTIPQVRVSVGFPAGRRGGAKGGKVIGQCHYLPKDGVPQIYIHPVLTDPARVLDVLLHEAIHAAMPGHGHDRLFAAVCREAGLVGKPTATVAGEDLLPVLAAVVDVLGEYPHGELDYNDARGRKQGTRMIKCECDGCGFIFRTTGKWINDASDDLRCPDPGCDGSIIVG